MYPLSDSLQALLGNWVIEVCQALTEQRKRRDPPQYDQKLGLWCGCQGYNPYYSVPFRKDLSGIPSQSVQPLLDALQQKLKAKDIVPIRLEIGKNGYALHAVRMDALTAVSEREDSSPVLDVLFALFL